MKRFVLQLVRRAIRWDSVLSALLLFLSINAQSQVFKIGDYNFTNTTNPYIPLTGDSTVAVLPSKDSGITDSIGIGFVFKFGNRNFNHFKVQSNGWMTFNTPTTATTTTTPITTAATVHIVAPFARDLDSIPGVGVTRVSILRTGSAPNRIVKIQWHNFRSFASTIVPDRASFQVWIYESTNVVEMRYGSVLAGTRVGASTVQVGLKSGSTAADSVRTVQGTSWPTATASNTTTTKTISPTDLPDSNRVYRFTPVQQQANDVAVTGITSPLGVLSSCPVFCIAPKVTVRNVGQLFAAYSVTYQITGPGAPYTSTRTDTSSPGVSHTITFDSTFCPSVTGIWNIRVFTTLAADTNPANDTLVTTVTVVYPSSGGGTAGNSGYFFANSLPCVTGPSKPAFAWRDTTGSVPLMIDTTIQTAPPGIIFTGTKDDGFWSLGGILPPGEKFRFDGVDYDSFYVSTNGIIGLVLAGNGTKLDDFTTQNLPSTLAVQPGLFPFWKDFNWGTVITGAKRLSYKVDIANNELIFTYERAPNFGATLATDYASFQVILEIMPSPAINGRMFVQFDDSRTGAEFLNKYSNWTLAGHTVGLQDITGTEAVQYRRVTAAGMVNVTVPGPLFASPVAVAFGPDALALPVELSSFTGTVVNNGVRLDWTTASEVNNYGYYVQKRPTGGTEWNELANSFIPGHGTTNEPHHYTFTDTTALTTPTQYRLKQVDLDGAISFTDPIEVVSPTGVKETAPFEFVLKQNYPNPFNPETNIKFSVEHAGRATLEIYNLLGQKVATLFDDVVEAGFYHTVKFNGRNLASGVYFYRLESGYQADLKKLLLLK